MTNLTPQIRRAIIGYAMGLPDKAIAADLGVSTSTAWHYIDVARKKLGLSTRRQIIAHLLGEDDLRQMLIEAMAERI